MTKEKTNILKLWNDDNQQTFPACTKIEKENHEAYLLDIITKKEP
jgi:hypothetical protein